jgi:hypothetical protein
MSCPKCIQSCAKVDKGNGYNCTFAQAQPPAITACNNLFGQITGNPAMPSDQEAQLWCYQPSSDASTALQVCQRGNGEYLPAGFPTGPYESFNCFAVGPVI